MKITVIDRELEQARVPTKILRWSHYNNTLSGYHSPHEPHEPHKPHGPHDTALLISAGYFVSTHSINHRTIPEATNKYSGNMIYGV